jgi:general secretion pathway protein L
VADRWNNKGFMADQLVLFINRAADAYRWCWLDAQLNPRADTTGEGDSNTLAAILNGNAQQAWLIVPGTKVITRELEYSEKEKKHLRTLLPFQLEDTVIGDIDRFHFALGPLADGKAALAYIEKAWMEQVFAQLAEIHIEVTRCWSAPATLPLAEIASVDETLAEPADTWALQLDGDVVLVRYTAAMAFSVDQPHAAASLQLLLTAQKRVANLPHIVLRGVTASDLSKLFDSLPPALQNQVVSREQVNFWQRDYSGSSINLERWWRNWRTVAFLATAALSVHIGILLYQIQDFKTENLIIRQQIEAAYRSAVPQGALVDAERQLTGLVRELQPAGQSGSVTNLLAKVLPALAENSTITLRNIQFIGDTGELNLQLQASEYEAIDGLRSRIEASGLRAELLGSSAQGTTHSARLKISQVSR